jgi:soluble lytic murein transglycosylase-like protein
MKRFGILLLALLWLLPSCGGKKQVVSKANKIAPVKTDEQYAMDLDDEKEESLAGSVSSQRLEELYNKNAVPGLHETLDQEMKKWEMQKTFDMPIQVNKEVRNYIYYFSTDKKEIFGRYLSRSTRYLPMIKKVFAEYGLPEDLAYLAMIESGYTTKARSSANAVGMWQFMKGTGVRYGLTVDSYVDERRDPEKATHAAAKYLLDLYKQFGSWYLAAASYNCGEGRVQKEIDRNTDLKSFWELSNNYCLPNETKNYVPQMIAATIIAKNPGKYGFKSIPYQSPLKYETIKLTESTSLQAAAVAATSSPQEMSSLNPELLRDTTPGGMYLLKIPPGKKEAFNKNIMMARAQFPAWGGRAYASRDEADDTGVSYGAARRSSRSSREYASAASYAPHRETYSSRSRESAESRPKAKAELRLRAAKTYDDLPKIASAKYSSHESAARYSSSHERAGSASKNSKREKSRSKPETVVASAHHSHAAKESSRASSKEAVHRSAKSEKFEGPVAASIFPELSNSDSKKSKKEAPTIARRSKEGSKSKKKKKEES